MKNELRVISWNLLRLVGAKTADVASLIERYHPDLLLMQEATADLTDLPSFVGGHIAHEPLDGRVYGLAAWSRLPFPPPHAFPLPISTMPGRVPLRVAQIVTVGGITFANVHLSHGQFLNRWQLLHLVRSLDGPAAVVGDYNAVGPIRLAGLRDIGPQEPTLLAGRMIALRLDRCMARGLTCRNAQVLARGSSDHHPILMELSITAETAHPGHRQHRRNAAVASSVPSNIGNWLRGLAQSDVQTLVTRPETRTRSASGGRQNDSAERFGLGRHRRRSAGTSAEHAGSAADRTR